MPKASSRKAPGKISLDKESLSSASQLAHFGVRLAKFTHSFSADGSGNFASGYELPSNAFVISVAIDVIEDYDNTITASIAGSSALAVDSVAVVGEGLNVASSGELTVTFSGAINQGKATFAVAYIDLSELS